MKYNISFDFNNRTDCILDNKYIKNYHSIPVNFSWNIGQPKVVCNLLFARKLIKLLGMTRYSNSLHNAKPKPIISNE